jgi:hypothetical protein
MCRLHRRCLAYAEAICQADRRVNLHGASPRWGRWAASCVVLPENAGAFFGVVSGPKVAGSALMLPHLPPI